MEVESKLSEEGEEGVPSEGILCSAGESVCGGATEAAALPAAVRADRGVAAAPPEGVGTADEAPAPANDATAAFLSSSSSSSCSPNMRSSASGAMIIEALRSACAADPAKRRGARWPLLRDEAEEGAAAIDARMAAVEGVEKAKRDSGEGGMSM